MIRSFNIWTYMIELCHWCLLLIKHNVSLNSYAVTPNNFMLPLNYICHQWCVQYITSGLPQMENKICPYPVSNPGSPCQKFFNNPHVWQYILLWHLWHQFSNFQCNVCLFVDESSLFIQGKWDCNYCSWCKFWISTQEKFRSFFSWFSKWLIHRWLGCCIIFIRLQWQNHRKRTGKKHFLNEIWWVLTCRYLY